MEIDPCSMDVPLARCDIQPGLRIERKGPAPEATMEDRVRRKIVYIATRASCIVVSERKQPQLADLIPGLMPVVGQKYLSPRWTWVAGQASLRSNAPRTRSAEHSARCAEGPHRPRS